MVENLLDQADRYPETDMISQPKDGYSLYG